MTRRRSLALLETTVRAHACSSGITRGTRWCLICLAADPSCMMRAVARSVNARYTAHTHAALVPWPCRVYQRLESLSLDDDETQVSQEFLAVLGPERLPYLQLIHQLIVCEENLNFGA